MSARIRRLSRPVSERGRAIAMAVYAAGAVIGILVWVTPGAGSGVVRDATPAAATQRLSDCPKDASRLTRDAPAPATVAALAEASSAYGEIATDRARVNSAARATRAGARGRTVRRMCGRRVERRTVVVELFFPEMLPSASLSQGTVFVSRFADGYHIWFVAH
jgi:hypothetical protein